MPSRAGVALDVDGTLVDSVFHHALCWQRAFAEHGHDVPASRAHTEIGKGGDLLVPTLVGEEADADHGDAIRASHAALFAIELPTIRPLPGARLLLEVLADVGATVVLASSAKTAEIEHYVDLLDARRLVAGWTTSDDIDCTKPDGEIVRVVAQRLGTDAVVVVGDSPWDVLAARDAGHPAVAVDTGGFGREALEEAGAVVVVDALADLVDRLHQEPFVRSRSRAGAS